MNQIELENKERKELKEMRFLFIDFRKLLKDICYDSILKVNKENQIDKLMTCLDSPKNLILFEKAKNEFESFQPENYESRLINDPLFNLFLFFKESPEPDDKLLLKIEALIQKLIQLKFNTCGQFLFIYPFLNKSTTTFTRVFVKHITSQQFIETKGKEFMIPKCSIHAEIYDVAFKEFLEYHQSIHQFLISECCIIKELANLILLDYHGWDLVSRVI